MDIVALFQDSEDRWDAMRAFSLGLFTPMKAAGEPVVFIRSVQVYAPPFRHQFFWTSYAQSSVSGDKSVMVVPFLTDVFTSVRFAVLGSNRVTL